MIDLAAETVITLSEATKHLPRRRAGKRPHIATLYRWVQHGVRGTQLETLRVGGTLCTSVQALQRFCERCTNPSATHRSRTTRVRERKSDTRSLCCIPATRAPSRTTRSYAAVRSPASRSPQARVSIRRQWLYTAEQAGGGRKASREHPGTTAQPAEPAWFHSRVLLYHLRFSDANAGDTFGSSVPVSRDTQWPGRRIG